LVTRITPSTLVSSTAPASSALVCSRDWKEPVMPALLTSTSRRPYSERTPLGGGVDADLVGDVQAQAGHPELVGGRPAPFGIARADQHGVPGLLQASRALKAQTLVPAGDHSDGVHDHHGGGRDGGAEGAVGR